MFYYQKKMKKKNILELENGNGFFVLKIDKEELQTLRNIVNYHFHKIIKIKYPNLNLDTKINEYHKISDQVEHSKLWPMTSRVLTEEKFNQFLKFKLIKKLSEIFGKFSISDENNLGYGELVWRLVRPNKKEDIGPIHCDKWFWDLNPNHYVPKNYERVKCWISLWCDSKNGLQVYPKSQLKNFDYKSENRHGYVKPIFNQSNINNYMKKQNCKPGTVIIFNDKLLHGGVVNEGSETRVSMEFTMFVDSNKLNRC